jgi:predicted dehydrogenase
MIKVAIIGLGHLGKWHLDKAIASHNAIVTCVVDPSPNAKNILSERNLTLPIFSKVEDCLELFDAAFVVTPTSYHFEVCKTLVLADKHVFCEKPLTSTYEESLELKRISKDRVFQVGHSERFHAIWEQMKDQRQYFENAPVISLNRQAPFKGRATDVDVVQDLMIHDIDLILYLLNEKPKSVFAIGKKQRTDKWDYVKAFFSFESGAQATITVGRNHVVEVRELDSVNEEGCLRIDLLNRKVQEASSKAEDNTIRISEYEKRDHLMQEHICFYESILGERSDTVVPLEAGITAVYFVQKVLESVENGKVLEC